MKKVLIIIIAFVVVAIVHTIGSALLENRRNRIEEAYREAFLIDLAHRSYHRNKFSYASTIMYFEPLGYLRQNYHTNVVFVHTVDELHDFPVYVFVMWPSDVTPMVINAMNYIIQRDGIDIERFGLIYPITLENAVDDWYAIYNLYLRYPEFSRGIRNFLAGGSGS